MRNLHLLLQTFSQARRASGTHQINGLETPHTFPRHSWPPPKAKKPTSGKTTFQGAEQLTEWLETYGPDTPIDEAAAYPGKSTFTMTRTIDAALIAAIRSRIDPMNRRSIYRVFGVIARNAIASYIARH